jgi:hypothetical protein
MAAPPLDGTPAGDAGSTMTTTVAPPAGDSGTGQTPPAGAGPQPPAAGGTDPSVLFVAPPAGAPGGSGDIAPGGGGPATGQADTAQQGDQGAGDGQGPVQRSLDALPPDVRDYIGELRREAAENRVKAKTAAEEASARFEQQRQEWVGSLLSGLGLMPDVTDVAGEQLTPEQQIEHLTGQLTEVQQVNAQRDTALRERTVELAIWKAAHDHDADPQRLTDSRQFMTAVAGLDPAAADFDTKVSAAIGTAVEQNTYYKRATAAQAAPPPPPVPSGGEFAGGPRGGGAELNTVDDFRAELRRKRGVGAGS